MINQGKISRGISYSPKISVGAKTLPEKPSPEASSKWSRVRNAFLNNRSDSMYLEDTSLGNLLFEIILIGLENTYFDFVYLSAEILLNFDSE